MGVVQLRDQTKDSERVQSIRISALALPRTGLLVWIFLLCMVVVAWGLRLINLQSQQLSFDEAISNFIISRSMPAIVEYSRTSMFEHPPLYYLFLHLMVMVSGRTEFALRYFSVACGTLTIPLFYVLGRRIGRYFGSPRTGLALAGLGVVLPLFVYYSQDARMYAIFLLLEMLVFYAYIRALVENKARFWALYGLASIAALGTHYFATLWLIPQFITAVLALLLDGKRGKRRIPGLLATQGLLAGVGTAWWIISPATRFTLFDFLRRRYSEPIDLLESLRLSILDLVVGPATAAHLYDLSQLLSLAVLALAGVGALLGLTHVLRRSALEWLRATRSLLYLSLLLHATLPMLVALLVLHEVGARLVMPVLGFYALFAALGISIFADTLTAIRLPALRSSAVLLKTLLVGVLTLVTAVALSQSSLDFYYHTYIKNDYRNVVAAAGETSNHIPNAPVRPPAALVTVFWQRFLFEYYYHGNAPVYHVYPDPAVPFDMNTATAVLNSAMAQHNELRVIMAGASDVNNKVEQWLNTHAYIVDRQYYINDLRIVRYYAPRPHQPLPLSKLIWTPENSQEQIELQSASMSSPEIKGDDAIRLNLTWMARTQLSEDYVTVVRLVDADGFIYGENRLPPTNNFYPTSKWHPGESVVDTRALEPLPGTPPGKYQVVLNVFSQKSGKMLQLYDAGGRNIGVSATLGTITLTTTSPLTSYDQLEHPINSLLRPDLRLLGESIAPNTAKAGEPLRLMLLLQAGQNRPDNQPLKVHFSDDTGKVIAEREVKLDAPGYPASQWKPGEIIRRQWDIPAPAGDITGTLHMNVSVEGSTQSLPVTVINERKATTQAPPITNRQEATIGKDALFLGYDAAIKSQAANDKTIHAKPGETLDLTLYWQAKGPLDSSYTVFTHLLDAKETNVWAQQDKLPCDGQCLTSAWRAGDYYRDEYHLTLKPDTPPGIYHLEVGMYNAVNNTRLPVTAGGTPAGDRIILDLKVEVP